MDSVLVIEDSRAMQRTLQRLFESDALEVQIASDGVAGMEIFQKQPPSVVVLDLKLPRLSGKELCRSFKTHMPSVPIVILSANNEVDERFCFSNSAPMITSQSRSARRNCWLACAVRCAAMSSQPKTSRRPVSNTNCCHLVTSRLTSRRWRQRVAAALSP